MAGTKIRKNFAALPSALNNIGLALLIALVLRLCLSYWQYSGDIRNHWAWAEGMLGGAQDFFSLTFPGFNQPNYPSLTLYLFAFSRLLYDWFFGLIVWLNQNLAVFPSNLIPVAQTDNFRFAFLKLPAILADLGAGWLVFQLTGRRLWLALLFLFSPAIIYVSTVWGQIESLPIFFLLLSAWLTKNKKPLWAQAAFMAAVLSKQTALWLLPFYLVWWWQEFGTKKLILGLGLQLAIFVVSFLPLGLSPLAAISWYLGTLAGSSTNVSDAAWNIWHWLLGQEVTDTALFGPISVRIMSLVLVGGSYVVLLVRQIKTKASFFDLVFLASTAAFFFQTRVHERHLFPAVVFLLLTSLGAKPKLIAYAGITVYFLANLLWSLKLSFI